MAVLIRSRGRLAFNLDFIVKKGFTGILERVSVCAVVTDDATSPTQITTGVTIILNHELIDEYQALPHN